MPVPSTTLRLSSPTPDPKEPKSLPKRLLTPGFPTASIALDTNKGWVNPWMTPLPTSSSEVSMNRVPQTEARSLKVGTYVAFQLDRKKIADIMGLREGSEERRIVLGFETRRYAGFVLGSFQHSPDQFDDTDDEEEEDFVFAFVGGNVPPKPEYCVPIAGSSGPHVERPPIQAPGFPWKDCYQYTVSGTRITPTAVHTSDKMVELDELEFSKFDSFVVEDYRALSRALSDDSESERLFQSMRIPDYPLPVEVWEDVSVADGPSDPLLFLEETRKLSVFLQGLK